MKEYVYSFNEGSNTMVELLGEKGANLAEMTNIGLPVPFGFTLTTEACSRYFSEGNTLSQDIIDSIFLKLSDLENVSDRYFGDAEKPLILSVRAGASISMPGMMDTILDVGLNDQTVRGLASLTGDERFAYDTYRRFIQMYGEIVLGISKERFNDIFEEMKELKNARFDVDLSADDLKVVVSKYKDVCLEVSGIEVPDDPEEQLIESIKAVFNSWNTERAVLYRQINCIPDSIGTAIIVQRMVFGNLGNNSCTGVAFSRSPANGEKKIFGEFLVNAQGEDLVAGIRTPQPINEMGEAFPELYKNFLNITDILEQHYGDMQCISFTIEDGKLYTLQTRNGNRTAKSAVRIAVDLVSEGTIDKETAVMRIAPEMLEQMMLPMFDEEELEKSDILATGLPASPGAACGQIYFNAADALAAAAEGTSVILVREETSPGDLAGVVASEGILTATGGMTSHAAVVAREMGKCCVSGCSEIKVYANAKMMIIGGEIFNQGDFVSLNGMTGSIMRGKIKTVPPSLSDDFETLMAWVNEIKHLKIRTNADSPGAVRQAVKFGAEGIGLCRTENMFVRGNRINEFRRAIMADSESERRGALAKLMPQQVADFKELFTIMEERPITIRLLDPPLNEFLPQDEKELRELADMIGKPYAKVLKRSRELREDNPMLGHRGCRLVISLPEIAEMQVEAIILAALQVRREKGFDIRPEILIPLTVTRSEFAYAKAIIEAEIKRIFEREGESISYTIGTMIEIPVAAITADEIAEEAEFFSFGSNDLTQLSYGLSMKDSGKLVREYIDKGIFADDPFRSLGCSQTGKLVKRAVELGKQTRPNIGLGICGEHGGDPMSIEFCYLTGLQHVSCPPYRVPIARLAAAQAVIRNR